MNYIRIKLNIFNPIRIDKIKHNNINLSQLIATIEMSVDRSSQLLIEMSVDQ